MTIAKALVTLLPNESKKLIAVGITADEIVKEKMTKGRIFVARGTTNSYVLEEMMAIAEFDKSCYVAGQILPKGERLTANPSDKRLPEILFTDGKSEEKSVHDAMEIMEKGDIIIKGANALDPDGVAGVLLGHPKGGTCGAFWGPLVANGLRLIIPIGLEKLVAHSILYVSADMGIKEIDYTDGYTCGFFPLFGDVFTEIDALETLFDLDEVLHVASGGVGGAEGAVTLMLIGDDEVVKKAFDFCKKLKTVKPFKPNTK
jgi:6-phosphogluconate dehydrogenase (decarboxylating)